MIKSNNILYMALIPVLLITLLVVYFIGRGSGKNAAKVSDDKELDKDIDKNKLSYPVTSYKQFADTIYNALYGYTSDDDFQSILYTFQKIKTQSDLFQLNKEFGKRKSVMMDYWKFWEVYEYTLAEWLSEDLSTTQKKQIMDTLENKNITFTI